MSVLFFNIKSKEVVAADSEPKIAAYYNSSDLGPNARDGQDFFWRLHPSVVVQMKGIKSDLRTLESISIRYNVPLDEIDDKLILSYISDMDGARDGGLREDTLDSFEEEYHNEIRRLQEAAAKRK